MSSVETEAWGTPSNTSKKVCSSNAFKSSAVDLPNKIFEAAMAFSYSASPWTKSVTSLPSLFC